MSAIAAWLQAHHDHHRNYEDSPFANMSAKLEKLNGRNGVNYLVICHLILYVSDKDRYLLEPNNYADCSKDSDLSVNQSRGYLLLSLLKRYLQKMMENISLFDF